MCYLSYLLSISKKLIFHRNILKQESRLSMGMELIIDYNEDNKISYIIFLFIYMYNMPVLLCQYQYQYQSQNLKLNTNYNPKNINYNQNQPHHPISICQTMRRTQSQAVRNNHHSLHRKESPLSLHSSKNDSMSINSASKPRKLSAASLKQNIPDLDKLIMDIKITPLPVPDPTADCIRVIYASLKELAGNQLIFDQVHAVHLLMQSIENKLNANNRAKYRPALKMTAKKDSNTSNLMNEHKEQLAEVSPIKQISEDTSSRILYTNLSLKNIEKSLSQESSLKSSGKLVMVNGPKVAVSKFEECDNNSQMEKLNDQIKYLEKLLATKTKGAGSMADLALFKKKSCRY